MSGLVGMSIGTSDSLSAKTRRYAEYYLKSLAGTLTDVVDNVSTVVKPWPFSAMIDVGVLEENKNPLVSVYFGAAEVVCAHSFRCCVNLETASFPVCKRLDSVSSDNLSSGAFYGCEALMRVYVPVIEYIGSNPFSKCSSLAELNMSKVSSVPTLSGSLSSSSTSCRIVVPDALVEDFKVATNWSTYADRIIGVTEYDASTS